MAAATDVADPAHPGPVLPEARSSADDLLARAEDHRRELTGYCYRMLGSTFDAQDAVQETMVRAWRHAATFEQRSSLRTWLYRIATRVCLDAIAAGRRRALPVDLGPAGTVAGQHRPHPEVAWLTPVPGHLVASGADPDDPAERAQVREGVRLALVAACQHLPARQRAVLVLREVLGWPAAEVAALLESSVASVNSALQRARATLESLDLDRDTARPLGDDDADRELLAAWTEAFERYDMDALALLLREDVVQSMPPYALWLSGRGDLLAWFSGPGAGCAGSVLVPVDVNGSPGYAQYRDGGATPWGITTMTVRGGWIAEITTFLETDGSLFAAFGLPAVHA